MKTHIIFSRQDKEGAVEKPSASNLPLAMEESLREEVSRRETDGDRNGHSPEVVDQKLWSRRLYRQVMAALVVNLGSLSSGMAIGFPAVLLPQIGQEEDKSMSLLYNGTIVIVDQNPVQGFYISPEEGSWIASIFGLGAILGGIISGPLGSHYGRRISLLLLTLPDILAWVLLACPPSLPLLLLARFLNGLAAAGYSPTIQIFVAETSWALHRGWLSALTVPIMSSGILLIYLMGSWLHWRLCAALVITAPCLMAALLIMFLWDSPHFYIQQGRLEDARCSLVFYKGNNLFDEEKEIMQIQDSIQSESQAISMVEGLKLLVSEKKYYKPFLILNCLFLFMLFSGKFAMESNAVEIFHHIGNGEVNAYFSAVIIACMQLLGSIIFIPLVKHLPRRILLTFTSAIMGFALSILGLCDLSHNYTDILPPLEQLYWLPLICVSIYLLAAPIGLCSIPFMFIAEFFPSEVRSLLGGLTIGISNLSLFVVVKTFPNLSNILGGQYATFWLYAMVCFAAVPFVLSFVPETKDVELALMSENFETKKKMDRPLPCYVSQLEFKL